MTSTFQSCMQGLANRLELSSEDLTGDVISITVDDCWAVHFSALSDQYIVMFTSLGKLLTPENAATILADNLFNEDPTHPRVGLDNNSQNLLLWSQIPIISCDDANLYQALLNLIHKAQSYSDQLNSDLNEDNITPVVSNPSMIKA